MKPVRREDIVDFRTYAASREKTKPFILEVKASRRIHLGPFLTFLFENTETVRYQIQEMIWIEKLSRESEIQHEIDTYNEILGGPGELGCTLLIEIEDPAIREEKLRQLNTLGDHLFLILETGEKVYARHDPRQAREDRLSSVQYLKWDTQARVPETVGCDHPEYSMETSLTKKQKQALQEDLATDSP